MMHAFSYEGSVFKNIYDMEVYMIWKMGEAPQERLGLKESGEGKEKLMGGLERQNSPYFPSQEESGSKHTHDLHGGRSIWDERQVHGMGSMVRKLTRNNYIWVKCGNEIQYSVH